MSSPTDPFPWRRAWKTALGWSIGALAGSLLIASLMDWDHWRPDYAAFFGTTTVVGLILPAAAISLHQSPRVAGLATLLFTAAAMITLCLFVLGDLSRGWRS